jgi:hypothetical protein
MYFRKNDGDEKQGGIEMKWLIIPLMLVVFAFSLITPIKRSKENALKPPQELSQDTPEGWKVIKLEEFYFSIPPDMEEVKLKGTDSAWLFRSAEIRLVVDYGIYPNRLTMYNDQPNFHEEMLTVDGREGKINSFRLSEKFSSPADEGLEFITAIHFPSTDNTMKELTLWASCEDANAQETARTIFRSIKFSKS